MLLRRILQQQQHTAHLHVDFLKPVILSNMDQLFSCISRTRFVKLIVFIIPTNDFWSPTIP